MECQNNLCVWWNSIEIVVTEFWFICPYVFMVYLTLKNFPVVSAWNWKINFREKVIRNKGEWRVEVENCQNAQQLIQLSVCWEKLSLNHTFFLFQVPKINARRKAEKKRQYLRRNKNSRFWGGKPRFCEKKKERFIPSVVKTFSRNGLENWKIFSKKIKCFGGKNVCIVQLFLLIKSFVLSQAPVQIHRNFKNNF